MHFIYNFSNEQYNFIDIIEQHYKKTYPSLLELNKIHKLLDSEDMPDCDKEYYRVPVHQFGVSDRKSIFIKNFHNFVDRDDTFQQLYDKFIVDIIKPLFNVLPEYKIIVQKTPNIRFHLPNCSNIGYISNSKNVYPDIFGIHTDGEFGHPKNEINIILPLTKMFETNSIYYSSIPENSHNRDNTTTQNPCSDVLDVYDYTNIVMDVHNFFVGNLNQCYHYNKINTTGVTRVSLDFRVLTVDAYAKYINSNKIHYSETFKNKFIIGDYYKIL